MIRLEKPPGDQLTEDFAISLNIGNRGIRSSCFQEPFRDSMLDQELTDCLTRESGFIGGVDYKFFPLPMEESFLNEARANIPIMISLSSVNEPSCKKTKTFKINVIETGILDLGFTWIIAGAPCIGYEWQIDPENRVRVFMKSPEIHDYLEAMFPVAKVKSSLLNDQNGIMDIVYGSCDTQFINLHGNNYSVGMLADMREANEKNVIRASGNVDRITVVVPKNYFAFHRASYHGLFWSSASGALLVRQNALDEGVVSHELAHSFGQEKEFYKAVVSNRPNLCCRFKRHSCGLCVNYKIPLALTLNHQFIANNLISIMGGVGKNIKEKWIDRDTYQKSLVYLSEHNSHTTSSPERQNFQQSSFKSYCFWFLLPQKGGFYCSSSKIT